MGPYGAIGGYRGAYGAMPTPIPLVFPLPSHPRPIRPHFQPETAPSPGLMARKRMILWPHGLEMARPWALESGYAQTFSLSGPPPPSARPWRRAGKAEGSGIPRFQGPGPSHFQAMGPGDRAMGLGDWAYPGWKWGHVGLGCGGGGILVGLELARPPARPPPARPPNLGKIMKNHQNCDESGPGVSV